MHPLIYVLFFGGAGVVSCIILAIYRRYFATPPTIPVLPPTAPVPPSSVPVPPSAAEVEMIQQLARHSYHGEQDAECSICRLVMAEGGSCSTMPICGHVFHGHCIQTWLMTSPSCPLCRRGIPT